MYTTRGKQVPSNKGKFTMAIERTDRVKIQQYGDDLGRTFTDIQTAPTDSSPAYPQQTTKAETPSTSKTSA